MVYEVYVDSLFLVNFVMNLYLYFLAAKTLKRTVTRSRIFIGSAVAAVIPILLLLLPGFPIWLKRFVGPVVISMVTTTVIFRLKTIETVFRITGYLMIYALVFGGMMKFLLSGFSFLAERQKNVWYILGMGMIGYQVAAWWLEQTSGKQTTEICKVRLCGYGREMEVEALIDTGNSLREPISGKPVSIVDKEVLDRFPELRIPEKLKVIPYHSVGKTNGIMEGYEIPELLVKISGESIPWQGAVVAISKNGISADRRYQMILHPDLCKEASKKRGVI
ncbi:MAG: sigma-E processing peptidase SpoIIGA [Lachnospiraceae bacterium]|nr:sigma-E processing peptidase SpoIIGA [Lachnospiraceae bacterium]